MIANLIQDTVGQHLNTFVAWLFWEETSESGYKIVLEAKQN